MKKTVLVIVGLVIAAYIVGLFSTQKIQTEINITASSNDVWNHLVEFNHYPEWNPLIKNLSGPLAEGGQLHMTIQVQGGDAMDFEAELLVVRRDQELRWLGGFLIPGLFDGEHYFIIEEIYDEEVRLVHGEKYRGILPMLLLSTIEPGNRQGFEAMNEALKNRVETEHEETRG